MRIFFFLCLYKSDVIIVIALGYHYAVGVECVNTGVNKYIILLFVLYTCHHGSMTSTGYGHKSRIIIDSDKTITSTHNLKGMEEY